MPLTITPTLRDRVAATAAQLRETGELTDYDGAQRTADAVLLDVKNWLFERAEDLAFIPAAAATLRLAARDLGIPEGRD